MSFFLVEVLANPVAVGKIEEETTPSSQASLAQGIVINFITCRSVADVYQNWVRTGVRPELPALPPVSEPQQPAYDDAVQMQSRLEGLMDSGDPAQLRSYLTGVSSCGHWIPAESRDVSGPTIEDSLQGTS